MNNREIETIDRVIDPTQEAVAMTAWFPDYLFGATEEPESLPENTKKRLYRHFADDLNDGLRMVCDEIPMLPADIQPDIAAYICGFPEDDLESLLQTDIKTVLETLDAAFPPIQRPKSAIVPAQGLVGLLRFDDEELKSLDVPAKTDDETAWALDAVCAQTDPEAFFPEKGGSTRDAKSVCFTCDARQECLVYALRHKERFGIWGGFSERERAKLMKENKKFDNVLSIEQVAEQAITISVEAMRKTNAKKAAHQGLERASEIAS